MIQDRYIKPNGSLSHRILHLWRRDAAGWPMLADGIARLRASRRRSFRLDGMAVEALCNPARIRSASARVDAASLAARPCYLCPDRLPAEQHAVPYGDAWLILCNPAPLSEPHFTIVSQRHEPQRVDAAMETMLDLVRDLDGTHTVFYNGPGCGASLPDHLHLQAMPAHVMPFERELAGELCQQAERAQRWLHWVATGRVRVGVTAPGRRPAVVLVGQERESVRDALVEAIAALGEVQPAEPEPMLNLFTAYADENWLAWFFPRGAHRPSCYGDGSDDFLISPGAVDLAGTLITPRPQDFERLDERMIQTVYDDVLLPPDRFASLRERLSGSSRVQSDTSSLTR